ncbi:MAG: hypothetical protein Fur0010_13150 [Bdellovibrio sp.]
MNITVFKQTHCSLFDYITEAMERMLDVHWAVSNVSDLSQIPVEGGLYFDGVELSFVWPMRNVHPIKFELRNWYERISKNPQAPSDLLRAVGKKLTHVVDATCGTGRDALLLVGKGHQVESYELNPIVYLLLLDSYQHLQEEVKAAWKISYGDFQNRQGEIDVLYYDPMFDRSQKSALPRKEMELFHLLGDAPDQATTEKHIEYFKSKVKRLVVKKDLKGKALDLPLTAQYKGKSIRFDLHQLK